MISCPNCGKNFADKPKFCDACGNSLAGLFDASVGTAGPSTDSIVSTEFSAGLPDAFPETLPTDKDYTDGYAFPDVTQNSAFPDVTQNNAFPDVTQNNTFPDVTQNNTFPDVTQNNAFPDVTQNNTFPDVTQNNAFPDVTQNSAFPDVTQNSAFPDVTQSNIDESFSESTADLPDTQAVTEQAWQTNTEPTQTISYDEVNKIPQTVPYNVQPIKPKSNNTGCLVALIIGLVGAIIFSINFFVTVGDIVSIISYDDSDYNTESNHTQTKPNRTDPENSQTEAENDKIQFESGYMEPFYKWIYAMSQDNYELYQAAVHPDTYFIYSEEEYFNQRKIYQTECGSEDFTITVDSEYNEELSKEEIAILEQFYKDIYGLEFDFQRVVYLEPTFTVYCDASTESYYDVLFSFEIDGKWYLDYSLVDYFYEYKDDSNTAVQL